MNKIKIESDIPIPTSYKKTEKENRFPFNDMQVGDSFFIEGLNWKDKPNLLRKIKSSIITWGRWNNCGWVFEVQKVKNGVRCWRVE